MKKYAWIVFFFLGIAPLLASQTIKIENGMSLSSLKSDKSVIRLYDKTLHSYAFFAGIDYFEHDYFYLSSEIGYIRKGGKIDWTNYEPGGSIHSPGTHSLINYFEINTTFRVKYPFHHTHVYVGFGPKADFFMNVNTSDISNPLTHTKTVVWGCIPEIGFYHQLDKLRLGINAAYHVDFNTLDNVGVNIHSRLFLLTLSIGYQL